MKKKKLGDPLAVNYCVQLWDVDSGDRLWATVPIRSPWCLAISPDGRLIASGSDSTIDLWSAATGKKVFEFPGHLDEIRALIFSPDGKKLISGAMDMTVLVWDLSPAIERVQ